MTLQVEGTVVVDGLGKERESGDSYIFWLGEVGAGYTDWGEMKSSCFSLSSLSRKGRSRSRKQKSRSEIGLKKNKKPQNNNN